MSAPEQPDWIERLRAVPEFGTWDDDATLWPLLCDVVEAAYIAYDGFGEDDHRFYGSQKRLVERIAALRAEVMRDA